MLDVIILHPVSKFELLRLFLKVYSGKHLYHPAIEFLKVREISISDETIAYADGEKIGRLPISVKVAAGALRTWSGN